MASTSVVFPWSTWAMMARLRRSARTGTYVNGTGTGGRRGGDKAWSEGCRSDARTGSSLTLRQHGIGRSRPRPQDPVREQIARDLDANVLLQYAFSKAARLSRAGQLEEAAAEYAKIAGRDEANRACGALRFCSRPRCCCAIRHGARHRRRPCGARKGPDRSIRRPGNGPSRSGCWRCGKDGSTRPVDLLRAQLHSRPPAAGGGRLSGGRRSARSAIRDAARQWLELARENGAAWRSPEAEIAIRNPRGPGRRAARSCCRAPGGVLAAAGAGPRADGGRAPRRTRRGHPGDRRRSYRCPSAFGPSPPSAPPARCCSTRVTSGSARR